jgi:hypothetical protein
MAQDWVIFATAVGVLAGIVSIFANALKIAEAIKSRKK